MKKYIKIILSAALPLIFLFICSCSADNSKTLMICRSLSFESFGNSGAIAVTVEYLLSDGEEGMKSGFTAPDAETAIQLLLDAGAMYKSVEQINISGLDKTAEADLLTKIINNDEFQLKCKVVRNGYPCGTLMEYYRSISNMDNEGVKK